MLSDYDSIKKNKDDNYIIVAKNTNINNFYKYYTKTFTDHHFPKKMFSGEIPESRYFKFILTINSNNYVLNIYVDTSEYTKSISSYNISFSDYNNSPPNIPYGILETFEE